MLFYEILAYTIHGKVQKSHTKTTDLKYQPPTWNEEFELPGESYTVSDIEDYFEYVICMLLLIILQ